MCHRGVIASADESQMFGKTAKLNETTRQLPQKKHNEDVRRGCDRASLNGVWVFGSTTDPRR